MSTFSIFSACFSWLVFICLFLWNVNLIYLLIVWVILIIMLYLYEVLNVSFMSHYESAFWLFILSEVIIFGTLITCCLYFDNSCYINLSSPLEIPFLGCFLLLGSSICITGFHHVLYWKYSWILLIFTIVLGLGFVGLQLYEMEEIFVNICDTTFHASSLCTVGLHFSHVLLGVIGLIVMLIVGVRSFGVYRCTVLTWYWHFVDYVWLFVYTFVYVCYYW